MNDPVAAALAREAGNGFRLGGGSKAAIAERALADLVRPGMEDSPAQTAERDQQIAQLYRQARPQGGAIAFDAPPQAAATPAPAAPPVAAPQQQQPANDPVTAALMNEAKGGPDLSIPGNEGALSASRNVGKESLWDRAKTAVSAGPAGPLEAGLSVASGVAGGLAGSAAGLYKGVTGGKYGTAAGAEEAKAYAADVARSLTYEPRTEAGKTILEGVGTLAEQTGLRRLAGLGPAEGMALAGLSAVPSINRAAQGARATPAAEAPAAAGGARFGSVGASGTNAKDAALALAAQAKSPELKAAIERTAPKISQTGLRAAERHVEADSLPVPIRLTAGQATQDVSLLSQEQNARGAKQALANRFSEQNTQLGENLREIRDRAAPDVFTSSRPAMGETIIDAYKAKDKALSAKISENYKALKDANGGNFPMDAKAFVTAADEALHKQLKFEFVPGPLEKQLEGFRNGKPMNFEQFEAMRTNLANIARSQADGNVKQAAAIIRDSLEALPMPVGAEHLKPLADAARASARERFALINADPAYKAVTRGKASADRFLDKYVLNADTGAVETMKANLAHDPVAQQTMTAGALRRLQDRAGLIDYSGNFSPAGYNKALEGLGPKASILFEPESKKLVEQLGSVARHVKGQPTGSFVNNSNTAVALLGEAAKSSVAGAANVAAGGVPIGTWARKIGGFVKEQKDLNRSLQTGAGLKLKDVAK